MICKRAEIFEDGKILELEIDDTTDGSHYVIRLLAQSWFDCWNIRNGVLSVCLRMDGIAADLKRLRETKEQA